MEEGTQPVTKIRTPRKFRSAEYLEGIFQLAEELRMDDRERTELAQRYQRARMLSGKTQRQVADDIGYTERQAAAYERGEVDQLLRVAHQWAAATGVRVEWLMTGEGDPLPAAEADRLSRIEALLVELVAEIRSLREADEARLAVGLGQPREP